MANSEIILNQKHHSTHWHYLRRRRTRKKAHTAREIFYGQILSLFGATASGLVLEANKSKIAALVGAYMILPGVFDLSGSAAGAMCARINHIIGDKSSNRQLVKRALIGSLLLVTVSAFFLAIFSAALATLLFGADLLKIFSVTAGSVIISAAIGFPLTATVTLITKRNGLDPDNFIGPIESSLFDVLSIISVTVMVVLVS